VDHKALLLLLSFKSRFATLNHLDQAGASLKARTELPWNFTILSSTARPFFTHAQSFKIITTSQLGSTGM